MKHSKVPMIVSTLDGKLHATEMMSVIQFVDNLDCEKLQLIRLL